MSRQGTSEQFPKQLSCSVGSPVDEPVRNATKSDITEGLCLSGALRLVLKGMLPLWNHSSDSPWKSMYLSSPYCWNIFLFFPFIIHLAEALTWDYHSTIPLLSFLFLIMRCQSTCSTSRECHNTKQSAGRTGCFLQPQPLAYKLCSFACNYFLYGEAWTCHLHTFK